MGNERQKYHTATYDDDKEIKRALRGIRKEFRDVFEEVLKVEPPIEEIQMRINFLNRAKKQSSDSNYNQEIRTLIMGLRWLIGNRINRDINDFGKSWSELYEEEEELQSKPKSKRSQFDEKRLKDLKRIMSEKSIQENSDKSGYNNYEEYQRQQASIDEEEYEEIDSVDEFFGSGNTEKKSRKEMYENWNY